MKRRQKNYLLIFLLFFLQQINAQDRYHVLLNHGTLPKVAAAAYTSDGGYIFCGTSRFGTTGIGEYFKLRSDFTIEWSNYFYDQDSTLRLNSITEIPAGGYLIAGSVGDSAGSRSDMLLILCNATGSPVWAKSYDAGDRDELINAIVHPDGTITAAGTVISDTAIRKKDILFCRFDAGGNLLQAIATGTSKEDAPASMLLTSDGNIAIAGTESDSITGDSFFLSKMDSSGTVSWSSAYYLSSHNHCNSFFQSNDGGYFLAGNDDSTGNAVLIKADANGSIQISKSFSVGTGTGLYHLKDVRILSASNEGYYLSAKGSLGQSSAFLLFKISNNLVPEWAMNYEFRFLLENSNEVLLQSSDLGCLLAGNYKNVYQGGTEKILLIKTDSLGGSGCRESAEVINEQFENPLPATYTLTSFNITASPVPFTAQLVNGGWSSDSLCATATGTFSHRSVSEIRSYPSPFADQLIIDPGSDVRSGLLTIHDMNGNKITEEQFDAWKGGSIVIPTSGWASGSYFLSFKSESGTISRKIVIHQSR